MKRQSQIIEGVVGDIELRIHESIQSETKKLVVLSHPHPLYGGTMDNKVVTSMERAFRRLGYHTVAYNFRGVGKSAGVYDNGEGEQLDLKVVIDWSVEQFVPDKVVLAGFSFGSYVTLNGLSDYDKVDAVCTVAPPIGLYDFSDIKVNDVQWSLIQGGLDEVVDANEVLSWALSLPNQPDIYWRANASHFFHGELIWLKNLIASLY